MNPALGLLIRFQLRGWLRYLTRSMRTVKGALLALVGLAVLVPWIAAVIWAPRQGGGWAGHDLRDFGPAMLLLYCLMNVVFSSGERAIYFPPAEVNFLFPGPFSRRQLLAYKIVLTFLVSLPSAMFLSLTLHMYSSWFGALFTGILLAVLFMQLFTLTLNLLAISVGARLYTRGRKLALMAALVLGGVLLWQAGGSPREWQGREVLTNVLQTPAWKVVTWPLRSFFEAVMAERLWPDLVQWAAVGLLVNLGLVGVLFGLDADYLEASATASARIYARIQRLRRGGMGSGESLRRGGKVRVRLPMLPWLGGIGPLVWRQLTTALRGADRLLTLLIALSVIFLAPLLGGRREEQQSMFLVIIPLALWLTLILTTLLPFDFRGDIDRLAFLKTLPLPVWRLTLGQLLAPVLLMTSLQLVGLVLVVCNSPPSAWLLPVCLASAFYLPPINFLLFGLDNLLFLLFPTRLMAATPGDFQALGRNVLFMFAKTMMLLFVTMLAGAVGLVVYLLTEKSWLAVLAAWPVVVLCAAVLVPLVAWAFTLFDVARDTPA
jgi:hypothetical protein